MKHLSVKILFTLCFCLVISVSAILAQKSKSEVETKVEPEVKSEPIEVKSEPSSPPVTTNDTPPVYEPVKSSSSSDDSSTSSSSNTDTMTNTSSKPSRTIFRNDRERRKKRAKQKDEIERQKRKARRRNKRDKKGGGYYVSCPTFDPYDECNNYEDLDDDLSDGTADPFIYFDRNDQVFFNYLSYYERVANRYEPYFADTLADKYKPLYTIGIVEAAIGIPYIEPYWSLYYEPDLDNFYIDFERFKASKVNLNSKEKFERLVIRAVGKKTIKRVGKKFKYKGKVRPVIVEDISRLPLDRIYTFNLSYLPKGKYDLLLLSRDGHTVKLGFEIE